MSREVVKATAWGLALTVLLGLLIVIGSRNLSHFDAALIGYTFSVLFATFGLTYRYAMWLQRPPTATYWRQGWRVFFRLGDWRNREMVARQQRAAASRGALDTRSRKADRGKAHAGHHLRTPDW